MRDDGKVISKSCFQILFQEMVSLENILKQQGEASKKMAALDEIPPDPLLTGIFQMHVRFTFVDKTVQVIKIVYRLFLLKGTQSGLFTAKKLLSKFNQTELTIG